MKPPPPPLASKYRQAITSRCLEDPIELWLFTEDLLSFFSQGLLEWPWDATKADAPWIFQIKKLPLHFEKFRKFLFLLDAA